MKMENMNKEGFWHSKYEPQYPKPVENKKPWQGHLAFIKRLEEIQHKANIFRFKGFSTCRICKNSNGSDEYQYKNWRWPSGYMHYIKEHNIIPSDEFFKFVMGYKK